MSDADRWNKAATIFLQKKVDTWLQSEEGMAAKRLVRLAGVDLVLGFVEKKEGEPWSKFFVFNADGFQKFCVDEEKEKGIRELLEGPEAPAKESHMIEHFSHRGYISVICADLYEAIDTSADNILLYVSKKMEELAASVGA
jgi:hypothetical protein